MNKLQKFLNKLKTPSITFSIIFSIISLLIIASVIALVCVGLVNNIVTYVLYILSAIALTYLVYIVIYYTPKIKQIIINTLKNHKFTNELLESYGYRSLIFAICSFFINIAYAVFQGVVAILSRSIWYGALATYYIIISLIRGGIIAISRKKQKNNYTLEKQLKSYRNCGIYLAILNLTFIAAIVQMALNYQGFKYAGLMIYVMATYTFYKLCMSIYNLIKAKKHNDYTVQSIKNISFADALISILALQTALLQAFAETYEPQLANSLTGSAVSIAIFTISIFMIIKGQLKLKQLQKEKNNE